MTARQESQAMTHDETAFQEIYDAFQPKILRYLKRLVGDAEAEDLAQDVFVKVSRALDNFRGESKLSTWLYRIATNTALDRLRTPSYRRTVAQAPSDAPAENLDSEVEDRNIWTGEKLPLVEQLVVRQEMNQCIQRLIAQLPENYRTVLLLSESEGLKNDEIAEILRISLPTVKIRLYRARERLREELAHNCDAYWIEDNEFLPELKRTRK
jgi:RNA polymerase sigma-70 factor (ECF subfamily)